MNRGLAKIRVENNSTLINSLEDQKTRTDSIMQEFSAYKEKRRLSGDIGALQKAAAGLQTKIHEQSDNRAE